MNKGIENVSDICTFSVADNSRNVLKNIPIDNMNKLIFTPLNLNLITEKKI